MGDAIKESNSYNENNEEIVPIEIESEDENIQINVNALPNSNKVSFFMMETLGVLMNSKNTLKVIQDESGRASILGTPIYTLGSDRKRMNDIIYDLTREIFNAIFSTSYTGGTMKK